MDLILRYAETLVKYREIQERAWKEDPILYDRFGTPKENPLYKLVLQLENALGRMERALAISVPTRTERVSKGDRGPKSSTAPQGKGQKSSVHRLRLA